MVKKSQAREEISALIQKYEGLSERDRRGLNEANTRKDYILPLFAAMGWHTNDSSEVNEEVRIGRDYADYAFRLNGITRFYLEAKALEIDLEQTRWAEQAVSYAYNKGISWAVLTNFEGLKLFSAEWDFADVQRLRVLDLRYDQYLDAFDDLWALSRESVAGDGLRKKFETRGGAVRKRQKVDEHLFGLLKEWRLKLIQLFVQYQPPNTQLRLGEIDEAVQRILDRLIFIRTLEDRQIEEPILSPIHHRRTGSKVSPPDGWASLRGEFRRLDAIYNSNLFAEHLADSLRADESVFLPMLNQLYSPDGSAFRFDFSVIEADVLGRVYEQYLGHVIETTKNPVKVGGQVYLPGMQPANAEMVDLVSKQARRKQQGIYYTPKYIVDYIVEQTLGKLLEERGGDKEFVEQIAVLDPACGSGSFLIAAYERLLKYYSEVRQIAPEHLSQDERVEILLRHIYGVDLDPQAVEITRLNLLLRALKEPKLLPEMTRNIVRGNSLVGELGRAGEDGHGSAMSLPSESQPLNWAERFRDVMDKGGFDVVIGNPPYVRSQLLSASERDYFGTGFRAATGTYDIYVLFIERAISLGDDQARIGFILPNKFFTTDYGEGIRQILGNGRYVDRIVDFEDAQVFESAGTYTTLLFLRKSPRPHTEYVALGGAFRKEGSAGLARALSESRLDFAPLTLPVDGSRWSVAVGPAGELLSRLQGANPSVLDLNPHIFQGLKTSADKIYLLQFESQVDKNIARLTNGLGEKVELETEILKPVVKGEDVQRYYMNQANGLYILYPYTVDTQGHSHLRDSQDLQVAFPLTWNYLIAHRESLGARDGGLWKDRGDWYAYARGQNIGTFIGYKFLVPYMATRLKLMPDEIGQYFFVNITTGGYGFRIAVPQHHDYYFIGLFNSNLLNYCVQVMTNRFRGGYFAVNKQALERLPIRLIDFSNPAEVTQHDAIITHVEHLLTLHKQRAELTPQTEAYEDIERQIAAEDSALDQLVYELYGLTDEEIAIVEGR